MKLRKMLFFLIVMAVPLTISGSTHSDACASTITSNALSGGQYVLTIQTAAATPPAGYYLRAVTTAIDPAPGCCCKTNLPCIVK